MLGVDHPLGVIKGPVGSVPPTVNAGSPVKELVPDAATRSPSVDSVTMPSSAVKDPELRSAQVFARSSPQ
jgi:hypothetical protein